MIHILKVHWNIQGQINKVIYNEKSKKKKKNQAGFFMLFLGWVFWCQPWDHAFCYLETLRAPPQSEPAPVPAPVPVPVVPSALPPVEQNLSQPIVTSPRYTDTIFVLTLSGSRFFRYRKLLLKFIFSRFDLFQNVNQNLYFWMYFPKSWVKGKKP